MGADNVLGYSLFSISNVIFLKFVLIPTSVSFLQLLLSLLLVLLSLLLVLLSLLFVLLSLLLVLLSLLLVLLMSSHSRDNSEAQRYFRKTITAHYRNFDLSICAAFV